MFLFAVSVANATTKTSFLPMEDGSSSMRAPICGVSVNDIKPFREALPVEASPIMSFPFGAKDALFCMVLLGVYYMIQRKNNSRSVGF